MKTILFNVKYNVILENHGFYEADFQGYVNKSNEIDLIKLDKLLDSIRNITSKATLGFKVIAPQSIDHDKLTRRKRIFLPPNVSVVFDAPNEIRSVFIIDLFTGSSKDFSAMTLKDREFFSEMARKEMIDQGLNFESMIESLKSDIMFQIRMSISKHLHKQEQNLENYKKSMIEAVKLFKRK